MSDDGSFDLAAAGLRGDGAELESSLEVLAAKLEGALPGRTDVRRRGGGLLGRRGRSVESIAVELGPCCYQLAFEGGRLQGTRERRSGGISIKREQLDTDAWIAELTGELREEADRSAEGRAALERLLG